MSTLQPAGPAAREIAVLWWVMLGFSAVVLVAVVALWLYAQHRPPRRYSDEAARRVGQRWIVGGGILLPGASITALLLFGMPAGLRSLPLPTDEPPLEIQVIAHQWWWEVRYPQAGVVTANQLLLPAGRAINVHIGSADVIHGFWVPRLAGKIDAVPGLVNVLRLRADHPGRFLGQCAEFCGAQHARMALAVEAREPAAFEAWLAARRAPPKRPAPEHAAAVETFRGYCGRCHRVAGVSDGRAAPDLSDLGSRPSLGAGTLPNNPETLRRWLRGHQELKPGNAMPAHDGVAPERLGAIADWLGTLSP